jgi:dCMP deaminase
MDKLIIDFFDNRPSFDEYFLNMAKTASTRSEDVFIQHGAIIVNSKNHIVGSGYNGFIPGFNYKESGVDPFDRDQRRPYMVHAEQNALANLERKTDLSTIYITGEPCLNCLISIISNGIKRIRYIDSTGSITENEKTRKIKSVILESAEVDIKPCKLDEYGRFQQ